MGTQAPQVPLTELEHQDVRLSSRLLGATSDQVKGLMLDVLDAWADAPLDQPQTEARVKCLHAALTLSIQAQVAWRLSVETPSSQRVWESAFLAACTTVQEEKRLRTRAGNFSNGLVNVQTSVLRMVATTVPQRIQQEGGLIAMATLLRAYLPLLPQLVVSVHRVPAERAEAVFEMLPHDRRCPLTPMRVMLHPDDVRELRFEVAERQYSTDQEFANMKRAIEKIGYEMATSRHHLVGTHSLLVHHETAEFIADFFRGAAAHLGLEHKLKTMLNTKSIPDPNSVFSDPTVLRACSALASGMIEALLPMVRRVGPSSKHMADHLAPIALSFEWRRALCPQQYPHM